MRCGSSSPEPASRRARALAALIASAVGGCTAALPAVDFGFSSSRPRITDEELRIEVQEASSRFAAAITRTADTIESESGSPVVQRRALLWKVRITPLVQRAALSPRSAEGLLELMALSAAQYDYLTDGSGAELFGAQQDLAQQAAREVQSDLAGLPGQLLEDHEARALGDEVARFARRHPIGGEFVIATPQSMRADLQKFSSFQRILKLPLTPFRALEGVESGAGSIREFNATARQFNELLAGLPQQTRWQLQLLLYDLETRGMVQRGVSSIEQMASSSERFSVAVEQMPESARRELSTFLEESSRSQTELRSTLAALEAAMARTDPLLDSFARVAGSVGQAGDSWGQVVREVNEIRAASSGATAVASSELPFDIGAYERTAREIRDAAAEIRGAAAEIRGALVELPARSAWAELVDRLFWRCAALLCIAFALWLAYRIVVRRLASPDPPRSVRSLGSGS